MMPYLSPASRALPVSTHASARLSWRYVIILLTGLLLPALACGAANPQFHLSNEVRLAVFEYEREGRGPVTDLVIHFNRDEPRIRFIGQNQNGGHTVWLYSAGAEEYFAARPPSATYLYIQKIAYNDNHTLATVDIYRGNGTGYQGWQLTLIRGEDKRWSVMNEVKIQGDLLSEVKEMMPRTGAV